jgi:non-heme chloroperoxidase
VNNETTMGKDEKMEHIQEITPKQLTELIRNEILPELTSFEARDGSKQYYRHYPSDSDRVMILLHGIAEDSKYLFQLARFISTNNLAQVFTPDLRGYGTNPERRGDLDYIGQLEDDIADFIQHIKQKNNVSSIIMAGHSAGGGTAIRFAGSSYNEQVDAFLLLAPLIPNTPIEKKYSDSGHSTLSLSKIIFLSLLDVLRIRTFHYWKVLKLHRNEKNLHGSETLDLSFRLLISRLPRMRYQKDLKAIVQPSLVLIGGTDELFVAKEYEPLFSKYNHAKVTVLPNHNHDGILFSDISFQEIKNWLDQL